MEKGGAREREKRERASERASERESERVGTHVLAHRRRPRGERTEVHSDGQDDKARVIEDRNSLRRPSRFNVRKRAVERIKLSPAKILNSIPP